MIHILTISFLIEKPFYLLKRQSFSFQIVPEYSIYMSRGWGLWIPYFVLGEGFVQWLSQGGGGGRVFDPFESCSRSLDEIDTCITKTEKISNLTSIFLSHMKTRLLIMTWSNLRFNVWRFLVAMATNLPSCFLIQFLEQLLKFLVNFTLLR